MMELQDKQAILIADNDHKFCVAVKTMLESYGFSVAIANDGNEALDLLEQEKFDLLITELRISRRGGVELLEEINRKGIGVPVIFLTAQGEVESYLRVMNMGAFDYLNKPFRAMELLRVVRSAIKTSGKSHISLGR